MRLLSLSLEGFGPFLERVVVDFRALRNSRLFLIHGPVGSGKTFLLDGICFSLYGKSSGGERKREDLRHLGTPDGLESVVSLDFEKGGARYRVERRFVGEPDSNVEATLWRLPEFGNPTRRDTLSSKLAGVDAMVEKLLGLTAEQFCQVAILPQGRFRRFLLAGAAQRREILQSIFSSDRYLQFQEMVTKSATSSRQELTEVWKRREEVVSAYKTHGGPREYLTKSTEELSAIESQCQSHRSKSLEWERSLEKAVRYEILDRQRLMTTRELEALHSEGQDPQEALVERLKRALPQYESWKRLRAKGESISAELHEQRTRYQSLRKEGGFFEEEVERARQVEEERFNLQRKLERLDRLQEEFMGTEELGLELSKATNHLAELQEQRGELAKELKAAKERVAELKAELERLDEAETKLGSLKSEIEKVALARAQAKQSEALHEAYEQACEREERIRARLEDLKQEREELKSRLKKRREREIEDALQTLKKELKKGKECLLCGSTEHPKPYAARKRRRKNEADDNKEVEAIEAHLERAQGELIQVAERKARLSGRLEGRSELVESEEGELDDGVLRKLTRTVDAVEEMLSHRGDIQKELRALRSSSKPGRERLKKLRLMKERVAGSLESVTAQYEARSRVVLSLTQDLLGEELRGAELHQGIETQKQRIHQRLEDLGQVTFSNERAELMAETFALHLADTRALERRREELLAEAEELADALKAEFRRDYGDWEDLSFALSRLSRESTMSGGDSPVLDRDTLIRTVERQLRQSQELLSTLPEPEMKAEQIRGALGRERQQLEVKVGRQASLRKGIERSSEDVREYDNLVERIRELEQRSAVTAKLASLAGGESGQSFHDWYLARSFRQVVDAANLRLEILAPNRFCLSLRNDLELVIVDFLASKERATTSLSGGESFLASLALALALGDVLEADLEGRERLQTLFIDEGFGHLDRRALQASLDCLESLKKEERTVGVISHVAQLRERIRAQLVLAPGDAPLPYGTERVQIFPD